MLSSRSCFFFCNPLHLVTFVMFLILLSVTSPRRGHYIQLTWGSELPCTQLFCWWCSCLCVWSKAFQLLFAGPSFHIADRSWSHYEHSSMRVKWPHSKPQREFNDNLSSHEYTITCQKTDQHANADAFSWLPCPYILHLRHQFQQNWFCWCRAYRMLWLLQLAYPCGKGETPCWPG